MKAVLLKGFGKSDLMYLGETEKPKCGDDQLLVRVKATALNRADVLQRQGKYPPPPGDSEILGLELSGEIEEVGKKWEGKWRQGDRVCSLVGGGAYAQYCLVPGGSAIPIPPSLSFEQAAAIPEAFLTAFQALFWLGGIQTGSQPKTVLIHAGASGVGAAAIQLVKNAHPLNRTIVTAGSEEKIQFCHSLGADRGINYKEEPHFSKKVLEATQGHGVDILIDFVGGPYWQENLLSLGMDGVMIVLGFLGGPKADAFDMSPILRKRIQIKGSTLRARDLTYKANLAKDMWEFSGPKFEKGELKAVISDVFRWSEVQSAHHLMEENKNKGKIVLTVD